MLMSRYFSSSLLVRPTTVFDVPSVGVLQQLPDDLRSPPSCYSYDALELLAELLRCDEASRGLLLDQASRVGSARRDAARDLFRSGTASTFISKTLPLFVLNNAGYVSAVPEVSFPATQLQLLIPREFAVLSRPPQPLFT